MRHLEIGKRIKQRRLEMDISASELATRLSMSRATIHRYENGDIAKIKLPVIDSIARELNVNPAWLLGKSDVKERDDYSRQRHDLRTIVGDFIEYMDNDGITCCDVVMSADDRQYVAFMLDAMLGVMVSRYDK